MKKIAIIFFAAVGFLGIAVVGLGLWFIGYPEKLEKLATDQRCSSNAQFIIAGTRLFRLGANEGVSAGDIEYMTVYQSYIEDIFATFQAVEFGLQQDDTLLREFVPIDDVLITKILPPAYGFVPPPYHNLTMGGLYPIGDVDGDGKGDFIASTADTRCSTGRLDYLLLSTRLDFSSDRNSLDDGSGVLLTSDRWTRYDETPAPYLKQPLGSDDGMKFIFNRRVVENKNLGSQTQIDLDSIATQNLHDDAAFFYGTEVVDIRDDALELTDGAIDFPPNGAYNVLNDLDQDGKNEIVAVYRDRMIVQGTAGKRLIITYDAYAPPILGARGDFDQDGVTDFWLGFPYRKVKDSVVGGLEMMNGAKLRQALLDGIETVPIVALSTAQVVGTNRYEPTSAAGIGYDLSREAGDIDGDGLPDLVTVSHYDLHNRGIVYAFLSRDLARQRVIRSDAPYVVRVMGKALSYIGTGLDAASDFNGDGLSDIVVGADVDHEAGFGAGAVYYLSGRKVSAHRNGS